MERGLSQGEAFIISVSSDGVDSPAIADWFIGNI